MDEEDFALNNLQWLIFHKTQLNPNPSLKWELHPQQGYVVLFYATPIKPW